MNYKLIFLCSLFLQIQDCEENNYRENELNIIEAKYNNWTPGIAGSRSGSEFYFTLFSNKDDITIDSALIGNETIETISKLKNDNKYYDVLKKTYSKNDTIIVRASLKYHFKNKSKSNYISYFIGSSKKVIKIDSLHKMSDIYYP